MINCKLSYYGVNTELFGFQDFLKFEKNIKKI